MERIMSIYIELLVLYWSPELVKEPPPKDINYYFVNPMNCKKLSHVFSCIVWLGLMMEFGISEWNQTLSRKTIELNCGLH